METHEPTVHIITKRIRQRMEDLKLNTSSLAERMGKKGKNGFVNDMVGVKDENGGRGKN